MMQKHASKLPSLALWKYGLFAFPIAFAGMPLYIHAPDFYATELGISLTSLGLILLGLRSFDAIQDPLIGRLSDRFSKHRMLIMVVAAIVLVLSFLALFQPIEGLALLWFGIAMLFATTAYSVLNINLQTLGGLWSEDTHQKTRITTTREACGLLGLLLAVVLPPVLHQTMALSDAFLYVSLVMAVVMCACVFVFYRWYKAHDAIAFGTSDAEHIPTFTFFRQLPSSTKRFFAIYGLSMLASSVPAILVLFFIRDRLDAELYTGLFLMLYFVSGAAGMWLWQKVSQRSGKFKTWLFATLLAVVSFVWAFFLGEGHIWQYATICVLSGVAFGADLSLPPSILADRVQQQKQQHAALQFSVLTFLSKAALAVAVAIVFPLLEVAGFTPDTNNDADALFALSIAYAAIPCAIKLLAAGWMWHAITYNNDGDEYEENVVSGATDSRGEYDHA